MPQRSRETFKKRQKELARLEKQRDKVARRLQRKNAPPESDNPDDLMVLDGPVGLDDLDDADTPEASGDTEVDASAVTGRSSVEN